MAVRKYRGDKPVIPKGKGVTVGASPKVARPVGIGLLVALIVFLAGGDEETALTIALAALGYGGVGVVAGPGEVEAK